MEGEEKTVAAYKWSSRNVDWYNSERRFIFACKSKEQRRKWMRLLRDYCIKMREILAEKQQNFLNASICEQSMEADSLELSHSEKKKFLFE